MLSLQKKFLFIHIPKTGGNSIQNILKDYSEDRVITPRINQDGIERFQVRNDSYKTTKHSALSRYKEVLEPEVYESLYKFATIRNPWDRVISYYFSPHQGYKEWDRDKFVKLVRGVKPVRHYIVINSIFTKPYFTVIDRSFSAAKLFKFSRNFIGKPLDHEIDMLIRYEQLEEDFRKVCDKLEIPYRPLPRRNKSDRKHYSYYYDDELKEMVRAKYIEEIEFCNYDFEYI